MRVLPFLLAAAAAASPAWAQAPEKSRYTLFDPTPRAALRELATDRPDKTESPFTVDAGRVQIEMDLVAYTRDREAGGSREPRVETLAIAPVNFKLGLTNSTDIQLVIEPYVRRTISDGANAVGERVSGLGDVTLRLKHNLWGNDGGRTALAVMPLVKLPTNSNGVGNDSVAFGVIVPLAIAVSERVGIGLMTQVDLVEESDGDGLTPAFINSATIAFDLTGRLGLYTEVFVERGTGRDASWIVTGDAGLTYAVSEDFQIDAGANVGISGAADDLQLFVGISRRF